MAGTADIAGAQRKVVVWSIRPLRPSHGDGGIAVRNGRTLPFVVTREWSAPAGHYQENFYIVDPESREIIFEGPGGVETMWGLQGLTRVTTRIEQPFDLTPGTYLLFFGLGGVGGGEFEFEAVEAPASEAA